MSAPTRQDDRALERGAATFLFLVAATAVAMALCLAFGTALWLWAENVGTGPAAP